MTRRSSLTRRAGLVGAGFLLATFTHAVAQQYPPRRPTAPKPLTRTALLKTLAANKDIRDALSGEIRKLGGDPERVFSGETAARPGEDVKDRWHQGVTLTPRASSLTVGGKLLGQLVAYNVFIASLKECLAGNYLPILGGKGDQKYAIAALYDLPGAPDEQSPYVAEIGFEYDGMKPGDVQLQAQHQPLPAVRLGPTSMLAFVSLGGGRHFIELTRPPADPKRRTRRFYYARILRL